MKKPDEAICGLVNEANKLAPQRFLLAICETILTQLKAECCICYAVDKNANELYTFCAVGKNGLEAGSERRIGWGRGIPGLVALHHESILVEDTTRDERAQAECPKEQGPHSILAVPLMAFGSFIGVLEVISNRQRLFTPADLEFVQPLTNLVALTLPREDNKTIMHLAEVCIRFLEERDRYTHGHSVRVTNYALIIAEEMQLSEAQKYDLRLAALLHDIGKITLKDTLLAKDNHLTKLELQAIRMHPIISHNIVVGISRPLARIIRYHHENYNGTGYPEGLRGEEIPFMSRLICLADAFDAMTTDRPYRSAMDIEFVLKEIREGSDKQFDPRVVKAFLAVYQEGKINLYQPAPAGRPQEQGVV